MKRRPGPSVRVKLALSYVAFLMAAAIVLLGTVWLFLLRYVPTTNLQSMNDPAFVPSRNDLIRAFVPAAGWALLFLLVFALVGGWWLAGRMLAPLRRITSATRGAASGWLSHRINLPGRADEFRELADSFDDMLARLEAHVAEQQRFAANASHELRTPLTITRTMIEVARSDPDADRERVLERLDVVNVRAIELTEALLLLSRADRGSFTPEAVDLSLVAEEAVEVLLPFAEQRGIEVDIDAALVEVSGSPALLRQLVTNLVHNAVVHNLPSGGRIGVRVDRGVGSATLEVLNTGATLDAENVARFTERFQRGSERARSDDGGVGLGLAIVKAIVLAHRGTLTLTPRAGGGLRVVARLPRR